MELCPTLVGCGWGGEGYWQSWSKSDKQLFLFPAVGGFKAWWQKANISDGTNCHWQPLTLSAVMLSKVHVRVLLCEFQRFSDI